MTAEDWLWNLRFSMGMLDAFVKRLGGPEVLEGFPDEALEKLLDTFDYRPRLFADHGKTVTIDNWQVRY